MDKGLYPGFTSMPAQKDLPFKIFVDSGNAPTLAALPMNNYITSVARTSLGVYTITLADTGKVLAGVYVDLSLATPGTCYAQPGPTTGFGAAYNAAAPPTVVIYTLVNGAAANPPAASPDLFLSGSITICDVAPGT